MQVFDLNDVEYYTQVTALRKTGNYRDVYVNGTHFTFGKRFILVEGGEANHIVKGSSNYSCLLNYFSKNAYSENYHNKLKEFFGEDGTIAAEHDSEALANLIYSGDLKIDFGKTVINIVE